MLHADFIYQINTIPVISFTSKASDIDEMVLFRTLRSLRSFLHIFPNFTTLLQGGCAALFSSIIVAALIRFFWLGKF